MSISLEVPEEKGGRKISVAAEGEGGPKRRIHLKAGEFVIPEREAERYMASRSCLQRCFDRRPLRQQMSRTNEIKSTKYEWYSFVPKNLFEQLAPWLKPANFYFLCIAVLQGIEEVSTTQGRPSILLPLTFVLFVTAIKDFLEDNTRRKEDKDKNDAVYSVYRDRQWRDIASRDILVGDIVRIEEGGRVPADVIVVGSGIENGTHAFVDTKALDGETNLKPKSVPLPILRVFRQDWLSISVLDAAFRAEAPNGDMSEWNGDVSLRNAQGVQDSANLTLDNLILSDCVLRNTPWIIGCVVYTGEDTKIRKNMERAAKNIVYKSTGVFRLTKRLFVGMALIQLIVCIVAAILNARQHASDKDEAWYLHLEGSAANAGVLRFFTWFIICKDFVPISLYVSLEMVQFWQSILMGWDKTMSVMTDGQKIYARVQTSRLNEELSQVHYIFSDKTGTLTQNSMDFRKCIIGREQYGTGGTEAGVIRTAKMQGRDVMAELERLQQRRDEERKTLAGCRYPHVEFNEEERIRAALRLVADKPAWETGSPGDAAEVAQAHLVRLFLFAMALNNSVFPKPKKQNAPFSPAAAPSRKTVSKRSSYVDEERYDPNNPMANVTMTMDSSSPDEKALAYFAQFSGVELFNRAGGRIRLRVTDPAAGISKRFQDFEDVCLIDFSAKRKRMTVIVRPLDEQGNPVDKLMIFTKGADSFVRKLLRGCVDEKEEDAAAIMEGKRPDPQENWPYTFGKLVDFGGESLRTLVVGYSERPSSWWFDERSGLKWEYERVQRAQGENEKGHVDGACSDACAMCAVERKIEVSAEMNLLGATAIEDKLQEGVPTALKSLLEAGIKIWVLTGDNVATAINIGISCNLLEADMEAEGRLFKFDKELAEQNALEAKIEEAEDTIADILRLHQSQVQGQVAMDDGKEQAPVFGIALHGDVWKVILAGGQPLKDKFLHLAAQCRSVVACRLEPKEKADIVEMVKEKEKVTCLAIGDGNNDTPMIRVADIGVGIRGVEGTSAVAAADYAISQFRFLQRLLLVYGRLNYRRIATLINYIFYKTSIVVWSVFFFGAYSAFSGQFLYLDWAFQLHNVAFTAFPILVFAVFDRDLSMETLDRNPFLYTFTRGPVLFNYRVFASWMFTGLIHGTLAFFVPWLALDAPAADSTGQGLGVWTEGLTVYCCVVLITNLKLTLIIQSWTWLHHLTLWGGVVIFILAMCVFSASTFFTLGGVDYYQSFFRLLGAPRFWFILILTCGTAFFIDFLIEAVNRVFWPDPTQVYIEAERLGLDVATLPRPPLNLPLKDLKRRGKPGSGAARPAGVSMEDRAGKDYTGSAFGHTPGVRAYMKSMQLTRAQLDTIRTDPADDADPSSPPRSLQRPLLAH